MNKDISMSLAGAGALRHLQDGKKAGQVFYTSTLSVTPLRPLGAATAPLHHNSYVYIQYNIYICIRFGFGEREFGLVV